jgi:hypothetical protein
MKFDNTRYFEGYFEEAGEHMLKVTSDFLEHDEVRKVAQTNETNYNTTAQVIFQNKTKEKLSHHLLTVTRNYLEWYYKPVSSIKPDLEKVFFDENTLSVQCKMEQMYSVCTVTFSINPMNMARGVVEMFSTDHLNGFTDEISNEIKKMFSGPVENMLHELDYLGLDSMIETTHRKFKFFKNTLKFEQVKQSNTIAEFEFYFDFEKYINQN